MDSPILREDLDKLDPSALDTGRRLDPVTPGAILHHEFLEPLGLTATALARSLGVPANRKTGILHGMRSITAETALRLAMALNTSPEFWLRLQNAHDLEMARRRTGVPGARPLDEAAPPSR